MEGWALIIFIGVVGLMATLINVFFIMAILGVEVVWYAQLVLISILCVIDFTFFMLITGTMRD